MKNPEMVDCEVCDCSVKKSNWNTHVKTDQHQEKALTQIMEDKLGKNRLAETRTETVEFLEELEQEFDKKQKS
jgi:hypothetical protein